MSDQKKFCAVVRKAPLGTRESQEMVRFCLGLCLLGDDARIQVVLEDDAVFHAMKELPPQYLGRETARSILVDGVEFDVQAFVVQEDLAERGLSEGDVIEEVKVIPAAQVSQMLGEADTAVFL